MAIYTLSVWPTMVNQVSACPPGRTLALANIAYITQVLFLVWTVAFNFVPGGVYTREHTDWLILIVMGFIFLGLRSGEFLFGGWCVSFFLFFSFFYTLLSHWEFLPWEIQVDFPKKSQQQQSCATQP